MKRFRSLLPTNPNTAVPLDVPAPDAPIVFPVEEPTPRRRSEPVWPAPPRPEPEPVQR